MVSANLGLQTYPGGRTLAKPARTRSFVARLRSGLMCFAKILCALKIARFPAATGCPIQVIPARRERQESLPKERPHCILVYIKDGGTRTFSRRCVGSY